MSSDKPTFADLAFMAVNLFFLKEGISAIKYGEKTHNPKIKKYGEYMLDKSIQTSELIRASFPSYFPATEEIKIADKKDI